MPVHLHMSLQGLLRNAFTQGNGTGEHGSRPSWATRCCHFFPLHMSLRCLGGGQDKCGDGVKVIKPGDQKKHKMDDT